MPLYEVSLIIVALVCMLGSCALAVAAWYHKDLRITDIMHVIVSLAVYGVITWIVFLR